MKVGSDASVSSPVPYADGHVEVRVQVARERRPRRTCGVGELGLRDVDDSVEVQPPERRGDDHSNCVAAILGVSRGSPAAPTPVAIIDSPRAAIMISPVAPPNGPAKGATPVQAPPADKLVNGQRGGPQSEVC